MPPSPQQQAIIADFAQRIELAPRGGKRDLVLALATELCVSRPTAYRYLDAHVVRDRQRRNDAGTLALTRDEALTVSAALMETLSGHGKQRGKLTDLVAQLRTAGLIRAERIDAATGELVLLSDSSIARALRAYQLHPEQLRTPTPHVRLSSPYPNYCWQVDASICVVYYLPEGGVGLYELKDGVHYKNKPENLKAIEAFRVIRYVATDHCSDTIRWRYYPHAESGQHTVRFLAWAMAQKKGDPFHGAPLYLMVDPGATAANLVKRFCKRLEIELIVNRPGNARAKGSVEKGQDIVETKFESGLKFVRNEVRSFDDLNHLADVYQAHFNSTREHSRHGLARYAKWMEITPDQLRVTPDENTLLSLATSEPEKRRVEGDMTVRFRNRSWNVIDVPGVTRGAWLNVHWHPFQRDTAMAVFEDADGSEVHMPLPEIRRDQHGFPETAIQIGTGYHALADTALETNRKEVLKRSAGEARITEAEAVRKGPGYVPLGGQFDPYKAAKETPAPTWLPRAGTRLDVDVPVVEARRLSATQAALRLQQQIGDAWKPEYFEWLSRRYPDGVGEDQIARLADQWNPDQPTRQEAAC
ncbi:integrase [Paraburkholderia sp.]|uniref:integrase n=1 Tax=Paraburkholderia sp. TaxID=1926495 RepID=UPI003D6FA478